MRGRFLPFSLVWSYRLLNHPCLILSWLVDWIGEALPYPSDLCETYAGQSVENPVTPTFCGKVTPMTGSPITCTSDFKNFPGINWPNYFKRRLWGKIVCQCHPTINQCLWFPVHQEFGTLCQTSLHCRLKKNDSLLLNASGELGIEISSMWSGSAPVGALIP